jgi:hypothetical protein
MPLYLNDEYIRSAELSLPVANALTAIRDEMQGRAVTPSLALGLIKKHLQPLIPAEHHDVLGDLKKASWDRLKWTCSAFAFRDGEANGLLSEIAFCTECVCKYTTYPFRGQAKFDKLENNVFLQTCGFLKINVTQLRYLDQGKFDAFSACKYCWRQPVPGRAICALHTPSIKHVPLKASGNQEGKGRTSSADYKEASRQKEAYDKIVNKFLSKETITFHESNFNDPILFPDKHRWAWLKQRRPLVAQLLLENSKSIDDETIIDSLLSVLHSPDNFTNTLLKPYTRANGHIKENPILIWPMLLRAEAWLLVRTQMRGNWGGKRNNKNDEPPPIVKNTKLSQLIKRLEAQYGWEPINKKHFYEDNA